MIEEDKRKIVGLLLSLFPHAKIYLYGSQARGSALEDSDIDLAIDIGEKIRLGKMAEAREVINACLLRSKVDLVDFHRAPETLKESITKDGVLWAN